MNINLLAQRRDDTLELEKHGNVLILNGEEFDFSPLTEGATLPASAISSVWFHDVVENVDGVITVTLFLPNPVNYSHEQAFPENLVDVPDGPVALPQPLPEMATFEVDEESPDE